MSNALAEHRPVLLLASPMLYHPACGNGGGVLCFELLRRLAQVARVHFIAFAAGADDEDAALAALGAAAASVTTVPLPRPRVRGFASALLQAISGRPRELRSLHSAAMRQALQSLAARHRPDVLLLQFPHMAQYVDAVPGLPVLVDVQDLCAVSRFREWRDGSGGFWRRAMRAHSWWAWARFEWKTYARAHRLMALSEADHGVLRAYLPRVTSFLSPVAWDVVARPAAAAHEAAPGGPSATEQRVLFMGNFSHPPNADGLAWVLGEVWPRVRAACPQAQLHVAGRHLPAGLTSDEAAGVVNAGFLPEVRGALQAAQVAIVPYRFGGGIKIKAVEAMAHGCPVVATRVGAEGLHAEDGVEMLVADDAESFAQAIVRLLQDRVLQQRLSAAGQTLVARRFGWEPKIRQLLAEIEGLRHEAALRRLQGAAA